MVQDRVQDAHKLPGSTGSIPGSQMLRERQQECDSPAQNGQHECSHICEQTRGHSVRESDSYNQGTVVMVPTKRHNSDSRTPSRGAEHNGRYS